ncbi:MAG: hypothetical protein V3R86_02010 [Candidatus Hydrothermarchaeaceae archaeon]
MRKRIAAAFIVAFLPLLIIVPLIMGTVTHESLHYALSKIDSRVEPEGVYFFSGCETKNAISCVRSRWTTDDINEQEAWTAESDKREKIVDFVDFTVTTAVSIAMVIGALKV